MKKVGKIKLSFVIVQNCKNGNPHIQSKRKYSQEDKSINKSFKNNITLHERIPQL